MAYIKSAAILTRIKEVVEDGVGTRPITAGTFEGDLPNGLSIDAQHMRTVTGARCEADVVLQRPSPASPGVTGNLLIYDIEVEVKVVLLMTPLEQIDDDTRRALSALAMSDADILGQALGCPGNLTATEAGAVTDLASGLLRFVESTSVTVGEIDDGAQSIETVHKFAGIAFSRPAV